MKNKKTPVLVSGTLLWGSLFAANAGTPDIHWTMERFAPATVPASYHSKSPSCVEPTYGSILNYPDLPEEPHDNVPRVRPVELAYMPMVAVRHTITTGSLEESDYAEIGGYTVKITATPLKEEIPPAFKKKNSFFPFSLFSFTKGFSSRWSALTPKPKIDNIYTSDPTEPPLYKAPLPPVPLPLKKEKVKRTFSLRGLLRLSGKSSEKPTLIRRASPPELSFSVKASPSLPPFPQRPLPPLPHSPEALEEFFQRTFVKTSDEDGYEVPIRSLPRNTQDQRENEKDLILFDDQQMTEEPIYLDVLADQESDYQTLPEISLLDDAIDPAILAALPTPLSPSSK